MLRRYKRLIGTLPVLLSLLAGFVGCQHTLHVLSKPEPISGHNIRGPFYVIGLDKSGSAELLLHEVGMRDERRAYKSEAAFRKACGDHVLWAKDCRKKSRYSFYIALKSKAEIEKSLNISLGDLGKSVTIKILEDHPATKSQRVLLDFNNDDYEYYSIYSVNDRSMTPLEFGDQTKGDGFNAMLVGLKYMVLFYMVGRIMLAIALRCQAKRPMS